MKELKPELKLPFITASVALMIAVMNNQNTLLSAVQMCVFHILSII